jgi:DNA-binding PadR family transcriptional regulator
MARGLGEFEIMTLLAVLQAEEPAYGVSIAREIERRTGRSVARGALHVTLTRLVDKGLLESWLGDDTPERGGRRKRHYAATRMGVRAARDARAAMRSMWQGLEAALDKRA